MPRLAAPICVALLLAALAVAGCGSGGSSTGGSGTGTSGGGAPSSGGGGGGGGGQGGGAAKKPPSAQSGGAPAGAQAKSCETQAVDAQALRATGVDCGAARSAMFAWQRDPTCALVGRSPRGSCSVPGGFRCQAVRVGKGVSVSCSAEGRAIAFLAQRD
jgi:hypothetical protein